MAEILTPSAGVGARSAWRPSVRTVRLFTGLVLFAYAASHLLSHAAGLFFLDAMERVGRGVLLAPWRTSVGRWLLMGSLFIHGGLGLAALVRRRHFVMPPAEAAQLALGLTIPVLLIPHVANVRLGAALYGLDDSYYRILYQYWIAAPASGLPRQFALMTVLWVHGCIGLYMWLRFRPWWRKASVWLLALAVAIPVAAMLGIVNAGWDETFRATLDPPFRLLHGPPAPGTAEAARRADLQRLWEILQAAWLLLLAGALAWRSQRLRRASALGGFAVDYPQRRVTAPRGYSLLEASRIARLPHASLCGGRGRCSTCRVQVLRGLAELPPASEIERDALTRIGAAGDVRLACQTRPVADVAVLPLVAADPRARTAHDLEDARESLVTALAVDLRDSTRLAHENLPYDALFVVDRYLALVTEKIAQRGGYVTSIAGDGVMSVFGVDSGPERGARAALEAALDIWTGLLGLNSALEPASRAPLRFGMGLHAGLAVVGGPARSGRASRQFLGDVGNVASRLEALTKERDCVAIASRDVLVVAALPVASPQTGETVKLRGRDAALSVVLLKAPEALAARLGRRLI